MDNQVQVYLFLINIYVVVNFSSQAVFLGMVMYANEVKLKQKKNKNYLRSGCKENHFYSLPFGQAEASIY